MATSSVGFVQNVNRGNYRAAALNFTDFAFTAVGFVPGGDLISATYFGGRLAYDYYRR